MIAAGATARPLPAGDEALVLNESRLPLLLGLYAAVWLLLLAWCARTPPFDDIEQLVWVHSLEWGYFKHPPLPTWILAAASLIAPQGPPLTYVLGAFSILGAHAIFWYVLRAVHGRRIATVLLLASLCITLYNQRLHYFNHNVVMMPAVAVCVAMTWRLTLRHSWGAWAAIGVAMGLGMLTKYQVALAGICIGLWWLRMRWWREPAHVKGLLLAVLIASALFLPHVLWLVHHDWAPLHYAEQTSLGVGLSPTERVRASLEWLADWLLNRSMPAWMVIGATLAWASRRAKASGAGPVPAEPAPEVPGVWREFWLLWGFVPMLLMMGLGLGMGVELQKHWGTAFMLWTLPAVLALKPKTLTFLGTSAAQRAAWMAFCVIQGLTLVQFWATSPKGLSSLNTGHWQYFPSQELADQLAPKARAALGGPIDIISGRSAIAGALALRMPEHPKVLINGDPSTSPWISPEELKSARIIEVFPAEELPPGAQWAWQGWAWRPGWSPLSRLQPQDVRSPHSEPAHGDR